MPRRWWVAGVLLAPLVACREGGDESVRLEAEVRALAAAPCQRDDECGVVGLGAKACGGSAFFVAYSINGDTTRLLELAQRHRRLGAAQAAQAGAVSDCRVETPPPVACRARRCRLLSDPTETAAGSVRWVPESPE